MEKFKSGDRVWVRIPSSIVERKIGTIMATRKTRKGIRYLIEWEVDVLESPNHHPGYLASEIATANLRNTS